MFNIIRLHVNIILIVSFVYFTFFFFFFLSLRYFCFVSCYRWFSLPFSRFLFVSLSLFPPLVLFLSLLLMFLFLS